MLLPLLLMMGDKPPLACWKVTPTFLSPKGITRYENVPHGVLKTVLY